MLLDDFLLDKDGKWARVSSDAVVVNVLTTFKRLTW